MFKPSVTLAVLGTVLTINAVSPAFAGSQPIAPNAIQLNGISGVANSDPDNWCGTRVPGFPPRPHLRSQILVRNTGILAIGPKQDDPAGSPQLNSQLNSTGVGNPGVISALNPQPLPPKSCANLR
ncbi:MAG: hypothetical protein RMX68_000270 [Aulosira sp. ZfuVER01]|nr:hypothetical protein [Aulosira sp. ZfuVER01]MDZ8001911.1 hypothetical protein [Aulosira sp. DedVER01a]MDZ8055309.1 hypothetical protein [Aulosira sp. ZfuCHP01]